MQIEKLKSLELSQLKHQYTLWLYTQNLSPNTVNTAKNDAFYILKHNPDFEFWEMFESADFEKIAREILEETLTKHSKGNVQGNINSYLAHLRRFRRFAYSDTENELIKKTSSGISKPRETKRKVFIEIPEPTSNEVEHYLALWNTMENYRLQEEALDKLFVKLAPHNHNLSDILIKTATLNDFYSTHIFSIYSVAKHIQSLDIDERLKRGDVTLVDDIKTVTIGEKVINFYSFATKYCSHHKPLDYPIYDSYVEEILKHFRNKDCFTSFTNHELKDFAKFKTVLEQFRTYYELENYTLKQLDQYLWQLGKKFFPKNYNSK